MSGRDRMVSRAFLGSGTACFLVALSKLASDGFNLSRAGVVVSLAAFALLLLFASRFPPVAQLALISTGAVAVMAVYATEISLALTNAGHGISTTAYFGIDRMSRAHKEEVRRVAEAVGVTMDIRNRIELLQEFQAGGIDAVPAVMVSDIVEARGEKTISAPPDALSLEGRAGDGGEDDLAEPRPYVPVSGISQAFTVLCNQAGRYVTYTSDEHGFRNPPDAWGSSRLELAAVGQSFVQGYCMPDGKGFVDLLRQRHAATMNLGMSGAGPLLQLATIKEYLPKYAPKAVLWGFAEGIDMPQLHHEDAHPWLKRYLERRFTQGLLQRREEIDAGLRRFATERDARWQPQESDESFAAKGAAVAKLWNVRKQLELSLGVGDPMQATIEAKYALLRRVLAEARSVTAEWGGQLYFVYLPSWSRYRNGPIAVDRERTRVLEIAEALDIPVIDVTPAFETHPDPLALFPHRRFGHYNEAGNRIIADRISSALPRVNARATAPIDAALAR